jgi:magnesium transporter
MSQARESAGIYANILDSTMDTYANIINNNMNSVMKMLTSINIILMFPTLVASVFGMNLINGMETVWWGFPVAICISVSVTVLFLLYFKRKTWI